LREALTELRGRRNFNPEAWIEKKCNLLNEYMRKHGLAGCVISLSGGIDSSCTLGLIMRAKAQAGSPIQKVFAIAQPIHSTKTIQNRAYEVAAALGSDIFTVDQTSLHSQLSKLVQDSIGLKSTIFADGQLRSYMRTPVNFYVAQVLSANGFPSITVGTGNLDEDGYLRYFCKAGDGVSDIQLIADIHKSEVYIVAKELNVPQSVLQAAPSADLWDGQTDEDEMGVSYDFVELYTEWIQLEAAEGEKILKKLSPESLKYFKDGVAKIESIHKRNQHKASYPLNLDVYSSSLDVKSKL